MNDELFKDENDIYDEDTLDNLNDNEVLQSREEAFMKGYDNDYNNPHHRKDYDQTYICASCGEVLELEIRKCPVCGISKEKAAAL